MTFLDFPHKLYFKGGGGQAQQIDSAPVPLPAPPVTQNNQASLQAEHDYAMKQLQQKSVKKTILAGDTGGYKPPTSPLAANPTGNLGPRI
jgi:hypothetical protein